MSVMCSVCVNINQITDENKRNVVNKNLQITYLYVFIS